MGKHVKPRSLNPMSFRHRFWLTVALVVAGLVALIALKTTFKGILLYMPKARETFDVQIDRAAEHLGGAKDVIDEQGSDIGDSFQIMKDALEVQKLQQAQEQEPTTENQ